ncbi:MAG: AAA family ATPase [Bacteroidota bacterium]
MSNTQISMQEKSVINYWLFQNNPKKFRLREALQQEALKTFAVKAHKERIKKGDKVIIWQTGRDAGCYALATVISDVEKDDVEMEEVPYFRDEPHALRVHLEIDYNLWSKPITKDFLPLSKSFDKFYGGLSGTNYKATEDQFNEIVNLVEQEDILAEPPVAYNPQTSLDHPLNLILYGAPGTGKTYQLINYALSIIENRTLDELQLEPREILRNRFNEYMEEGWIQFVTFHPSYAYEDFVEGIKPITNDGKVLYEVEDGIFKYMALMAKRHIVEVLLSLVPVQEINIDWDAMYQAFLLYLESDDFNSFASRTGKKMMLQKIERNGNLVVRPENSFLAYTISKAKLKKLYKNFQSVDDIQHTQNDISLLLGAVNTRAYWSAFSELKKFEPAFVQSMMENQDEIPLNDPNIDAMEMKHIAHVAQSKANRFVLIIDEINRGNVASIFGDLITLIEADKREGNAEALKTVLPYSKTYFCVPPNLHIIGTMNTADRSVEALDAALRRRFTFVEAKSRPELLSQPAVSGVNLARMLTKMNQRIEILLDEDHVIGHSYFFEVETLAELKSVFSNKVLPLLQEYFYGDLGKIGLVLGKDFLEEQKFTTDMFADFEYEYIHELADKKVYQIRNVEELEADSFIRIYEKDYP